MFAGRIKLDVDMLAVGLAPNCIKLACKLPMIKILFDVIAVYVAAVVVRSV